MLRALLITCALVSTASAQSPSTPITWIELGAKGKIIARAIVAAAARAETAGAKPAPTEIRCPSIVVDEAKPRPMKVRARPTPPDYAVLSCEWIVSANAKSASIAGIPLALPKKDPKVIAVIGDTGCRLKGENVQACNDPKQWPFATVAARIASMHPDLVIHVGDYHYRETSCPAGEKSCAGPFGQVWAVWSADFFQPAAPLLRAAPWILVRGNHEDCSRAGEGWFRFLDAAKRPAACQDLMPPFRVPVGTSAGKALDFVVIDVAGGKDPLPASAYQIDKIKKLARPNAGMWLLLHRPIWWQKASQPGQDVVGANKGDAPQLPPSVEMVLSGHLHTFGALSFEDSLRSAQFVVGDGGTALDTKSVLAGTGGLIYGEKFEAQEWKGQFGFALLVKKGEGWEATGYDPGGKAFAVCRVVSRAIHCDRRSTN